MITDSDKHFSEFLPTRLGLTKRRPPRWSFKQFEILTAVWVGARDQHVGLSSFRIFIQMWPNIVEHLRFHGFEISNF